MGPYYVGDIWMKGGPFRSICLPIACKPQHTLKCFRRASHADKYPGTGAPLGPVAGHLLVLGAPRPRGLFLHSLWPRIMEGQPVNLSASLRGPPKMSRHPYIGAAKGALSPAAIHSASSGGPPGAPEKPKLGATPLHFSLGSKDAGALQESFEGSRGGAAGEGPPGMEGAPLGASECPSGRGPRVAFWELLGLLKEDKMRVAGVILALLLSSGTQLLLPLAVGKLVDAAAQTPVQQQQQQQKQQVLLQQQVQQQGAEHPIMGFTDTLRGPEGPQDGASGAATAATGAAEAAATAAAVSAGLETATAAPTAAGGERSSWGHLIRTVEDRLQTPGARLGLCVALGAVGAITSFTRLFLLESTVRNPTVSFASLSARSASHGIYGLGFRV